MNKVNLDFNTGSVDNFGLKTHINLHDRNGLSVSRSLTDKQKRHGTIKVENDDWQLQLFINHPEEAREMADKLTEIANFIEDKDNG